MGIDPDDAINPALQHGHGRSSFQDGDRWLATAWVGVPTGGGTVTRTPPRERVVRLLHQASSAGSGPLPPTAGGQVRRWTPPRSVIPTVTPTATDRGPDHHRTTGSLTVIPPGPTSPNDAAPNRILGRSALRAAAPAGLRGAGASLAATRRPARPATGAPGWPGAGRPGGPSLGPSPRRRVGWPPSTGQAGRQIGGLVASCPGPGGLGLHPLRRTRCGGQVGPAPAVLHRQPEAARPPATTAHRDDAATHTHGCSALTLTHSSVLLKGLAPSNCWQP